jgi:D-alanine-D-alanine ligase
MLNVAVIYGGFGEEREVSLNSGLNIVANLDKTKFNVFPLEIRNDRNWILQDIEKLEQISKLKNGFLTEKEFLKQNDLQENIQIINPWNWFAENKIDVAYLALHGKWGEDGGIQSLLDYLQIAYTGSGALASSIAMDKLKTQQILSNYGILTVPTLAVDFGNREGLESEIKDFLEYPLFAKPRFGGSSCGNKVLNNYQDSLELGGEYMLQKIIKGKEFTAPIMGNTKIIEMPIIEIISDNNFDYFDKYISTKTQEICPAQIDFNLQKELQKYAKIAHIQLGCSGLTRSDFLVTNINEIFYLETNTTPGYAISSLCPKSAKAMGWSISQFLEFQIKLALEKNSKLT